MLLPTRQYHFKRRQILPPNLKRVCSTEGITVAQNLSVAGATTNRCQLRVGISESQISIVPHQTQSVKIYDGSKVVDGISFIKTSTGLVYCNWIINNQGIDENTNIAGLAIVDKAIARKED